MPKTIINAHNIADILQLIDTWKGKLTWSLLCKEVTLMLSVKGITRQSLSSYKEIQDAYTRRKQLLREAPISEPSSKNSNVEYLISQVESLEAELNRANAQIERYKQRFVLWQFNAYKHGIRMERLDDAIEMLEKPLHKIERK